MTKPSAEDLAKRLDRFLKENLRAWDRRATFSVVPNSRGNVHLFVRSRRLADIQAAHGDAAAREALGLGEKFGADALTRIKIRAGA